MNPFFDPTFETYYHKYPLRLVDIGVRGGIHARWNQCRKHLQVIGFEPDPEAFRALANESSGSKSHTYLNTALSNVDGQADFYNTRSPGSSSLLRPNAKFLSEFPEADRWDIISTTKVIVTPLDRVLREAGIDGVDFIKLDTQGTELLILQGGSKTLDKSVFGIEVEVEFAELYQEQPMFSDVDQYLRSLGFALFDMRTIDWKRENAKYIGGRKGQMVFADALYLKTPEALLIDADCSKAAFLKALTICVVYGYLDYALSLCEQAHGLNTLEDKELDLITKHLRKPRHLAFAWPGFRGRDRIANAIYMIYDVFRSRDWSHSGSSGRYLGNDGDPLIRG